MPNTTPLFNPPDPAGVYFCPPCEKFEDLTNPPEWEKKALSYAGQDANGSPIFWIFENGKWDERSVLLVTGSFCNRNFSQRTLLDQPRVVSPSHLFPYREMARSFGRVSSSGFCS